MQQLLGDKPGASTDANSFLQKLFLQQLPPNIRMVLPFADPSTTLKNLVDMADKIMEVAVAAVSTIDDSEVNQLSEEVSLLVDVVASLSQVY